LGFCFFKQYISKTKELENQLTLYISVLKNLGFAIEVPVKALELILSKKFRNDLLELFIKRGREKGTSIKGVKDSFEEVGFVNCLRIIQSILKKRTPKKIRGHRDYNVFTTVPNSVLEFIAENIGLIFTELDIRNAYPRFAFALNGLELPNDFYGVDRAKNKKGINVLLNDLVVKVNKFVNDRRNKGIRTSEKQKKNHVKNKRKNNKRKLLEYSFSVEVVKWLIDNFSKDNSDAFFNLMSYHENSLIKKLHEEIVAYNNSDSLSYSMFRKHDAVLIFSELELELSPARGITYLGFNGWIG